MFGAAVKVHKAQNAINSVKIWTWIFARDPSGALVTRESVHGKSVLSFTIHHDARVQEALDGMNLST